MTERKFTEKQKAARRAAWRRWYRRNRDRMLDRARERREREGHYVGDPAKVKARKTLRNAERSGRIVRPDRCSDCGTVGPVHGHHADYDKPFEVEWLCGWCHGARHQKDAA